MFLWFRHNKNPIFLQGKFRILAIFWYLWQYKEQNIKETPHQEILSWIFQKMNNDTLMITSVIFSLNKILMNTNYCGAIHLKVICFEHSFEIIHCIIHPCPEYSPSICQLVTEGHPEPEAMFVNLGNLSRFVFHKLVWSFLVLMWNFSICSLLWLWVPWLEPKLHEEPALFLSNQHSNKIFDVSQVFFQKSSEKSISLLDSTQNFIKFSYVLTTFSQTDDGQPTELNLV